MPSRVFDDTSVWTARMGTSARSLLVGGRPSSHGYYLWDDAAAPRPVRPAETWHNMHLTKLGDGLFQWNTGVDFGVGDIGAARVAALFGAFVGASEGRTEAQIRADHRSAFPRTTAALGLLASIDTLRVSTADDGSTTQYLVIRLDPRRLERRFPHLASYLKKYVSSGKARMVLRDRSDVTWLTGDFRDERLRFHLRTRGGRLAPLTGPLRTLPDSMLLETDVTMKVKLFTVGFNRLVTDLIIERDSVARMWSLIARREPEWHLPLITERLIRSPLKRPFMGRGAMFRLGVRDERGTTILTRSLELVVEESGILRFLSSLGGTVMDDFDPRTEREQHQYVREIFLAMQMDIRALASGSE